MSDGFLRQRRNLMGSTILIAMLLILGISFSSVAPMGVKINIENTTFVPWFLLIVHAYFIYRFATHWYDESQESDAYKGYNYRLKKAISDNLYKQATTMNRFEKQKSTESTTDYIARTELERASVSKMLTDRNMMLLKNIFSSSQEILSQLHNGEKLKFNSLNETQKALLTECIGVNYEVISQSLATGFKSILFKDSRSKHTAITVTDDNLSSFKKQALLDTYLFGSFASNYVVPVFLSAIAFGALITGIYTGQLESKKPDILKPTVKVNLIVNVDSNHLVDTNITVNYPKPSSLQTQQDRNSSKQ